MRRLGRSFLVSALVLSVAGLLSIGCAAAPSSNPDERMRTIGVLRAVQATTGSSEDSLLDELRRAGFVAGRTLRVLGADGAEAYADPRAAQAAVRGWVRDNVEVVVALSTSSAVAARAAAPKTTVLFLANDPVAAGLVRDERRPEGRLTGVTFRVSADRTLALARELVPGLTRIGLAYPETDPAATPHRDSVQGAADRLGMQLLTHAYADDGGIRPAVDALVAGGATALVASTSPAATRTLPSFEAAAAAARLPVIANSPVATFALVSVYPDTERLLRQLGRQAVRVLRGERPNAIPVEDPRRFTIALNQAVAASLGITIPEELLREADLVRR